MDKIKITSDELAQVSIPASPSTQEQMKTRLIPMWFRILSWLLVLCPPLLYILTLVVLPHMRKRPLALKHAWAVHLCCLLLVSGILWLIAGLFFGVVGQPPTPLGESAALTLSRFPALPSTIALSAKDIAKQLRPLVLVVHNQPDRIPFSGGLLFPPRFGAAVIVHADTNGCLAVTSRHVVQLSARKHDLRQQVVVADESGAWVSCRIVGRHRELDMALLWITRVVTTNAFSQPIRTFSSIDLGDKIYAIGHPQGLDFSISTGIISQKRGHDLLQVSAPLSPGSSGGPIYDQHGVLLGIVQSVADKGASPNAENLNFAVRADALLDSEGWELNSRGEEALAAFRDAPPVAAQPTAAQPGNSEMSDE